jgi:hypothetical protein
MALYAVFTLSMPNRGSWNGGWSGERDKYVVARTVKNEDLNGRSFYYNFGDGWGANVHVDVFEGAKAKNAAVKGSKGFCGYDWMVDSILNYDRILTDDQIAKLKETSRMKD